MNLKLSYHEAFQTAFLVLVGGFILVALVPNATGAAQLLLLLFGGGFVIVGLFVLDQGLRSAS